MTQHHHTEPAVDGYLDGHPRRDGDGIVRFSILTIHADAGADVALCATTDPQVADAVMVDLSVGSLISVTGYRQHDTDDGTVLHVTELTCLDPEDDADTTTAAQPNEPNPLLLQVVGEHRIAAWTRQFAEADQISPAQARARVKDRIVHGDPFLLAATGQTWIAKTEQLAPDLPAIGLRTNGVDPAAGVVYATPILADGSPGTWRSYPLHVLNHYELTGWATPTVDDLEAHA